jgi:hypothetical protein
LKTNGYTKVDTLRIPNGKPDGTLLGDGFTDKKESKLFFKENVKFKGKYKDPYKTGCQRNR